MHLIECALVLARESAGSNIEARIAMIADHHQQFDQSKGGAWKRRSVGAWERRSV